jgi:hypothetical protein
MLELVDHVSLIRCSGLISRHVRRLRAQQALFKAHHCRCIQSSVSVINVPCANQLPDLIAVGIMKHQGRVATRLDALNVLRCVWRTVTPM